MNQLNPLHVGVLLLVILAFSFFKLDEAKKELFHIQQKYKETENIARELKALKAVYANKQKTKHTLEKILSQSSFRRANIHMKKSKKVISISGSSLEYKVLNSFMGKILNGNFNIIKLKIKKLNDTQAHLDMEIQW